MEKAIEFNVQDLPFKKFLEESLKDYNIEYDIKKEKIENNRTSNKTNEVFCVYVKKENIEKVQELEQDFDNARIAPDEVFEIETDKKKKGSTLWFTIAFFIIVALVILGVICFKK